MNRIRKPPIDHYTRWRLRQLTLDVSLVGPLNCWQWEREYIRQLILEATDRIEKRATKPKPTTTTEEDKSTRLFIHLQYHPDDSSRGEIRQLYNEHCGELFKKLMLMGIERPIIAYSRPKNIGDYATQAKLHEAPGRTASTIMGEYKQGLAP